MSILKPQQAADRLGIPKGTLSSWRYQDRGDGGYRGPRWVEVNGRCIGYRPEALDEWAESHETGGEAA